MKKVSIIYWSNGGNVEVIANAIAEGASIGDVEIETKHVADASITDVLEADAVAFGSPAMINDDIEEIDMKPFINSLRGLEIKNKPLILFGSSGLLEIITTLVPIGISFGISTMNWSIQIRPTIGQYALPTLTLKPWNFLIKPSA